MSGDTFYFFEYDRPGKKTPGRTTWRMTIADAELRYPGYRPILDTAEVRHDYKFHEMQMHAPGTGPVHWFKDEKKPV
jgi:hypothetical protein